MAEVTPSLAIGISRGRFLKGYAHTDPNEDAVFAATDGETTVLAVADGHFGSGASHRSIEVIAERAATALEAPNPLELLVVAAMDEADLETPSRTALSICIGKPSSLAWVTWGDTGVVVGGGRRGKVQVGDAPFLGEGGVPNRGVEEAGGAQPFLVGSDGLFDFARVKKWPVSGAPAREEVERLIDEAFRGGAGDNISVAVCTAR